VHDDSQLTADYRLWLVPCLALWLSACASFPKAPFTASSIARNNGNPHQVLIKGRGLDAVVDRLIALAKQRKLTLIYQAPVGKVRNDLAFRSKPNDRRVRRRTYSATVGYHSRYFVEVQKKGDAVMVTAAGVPVLNERMACPDYLKKRKKCLPPMLGHYEGSNVVDSTYQSYGLNVSGSQEAEILAGLLAELGRAKPAESAAPPPAKRLRQPIVAVFDIQDRTGTMKSRILDQLTEYLAAQVTQRAGFKVIPRGQLRRRLSAEKVKSYRRCVDQRWQIELGKAVAAQKSLATKLLRGGKQCALTALLYDLKTEATDRAASVKTDCNEEALLAGVEKLAAQLK